MSVPRAIGPRIVVKVDDAVVDGFDKKSRTITKQGFITSASTEDFEREREYGGQGIVVELGAEAYNLQHHGKPWCKVGDRVIFDRYEGFKHKDEATDTLYRIIMDDRVISVIDEE